ncbi:MAG TPA: SDR family oxidoreductase, partial [Magnetospirillaceae bacterium]
KAPFFVTQRLTPLLKDGGRVINISSRPSTVAFPFNITYALAKAALNSMTKSLARELGPRGITVNAVAPGVIETDRTVPRMLSTPEQRAAVAATTALKRVGTAADVADVVAFLASDEARWVTGAYIEAAGGAGLG